MAKTNNETATVTGGRLVAEGLNAIGVRHVFGVPGGQTLAITDNMRAGSPVRFIAARHEGAAACMADAVGRLTKQPGVCLATTGPGATNMLTGIGGAFRDSSPMIAITCNNRLADLDKDDAQAADHIAIFKPLVKWAKLVVDARQIPQAIAEAYVRATTGCPGPVLLDFARDVLELPCDAKLLDAARAIGHVATARRERPAADMARLAEAAELLRSARSPVLWLGNGVKLAEAGDQALDLARALDMPVITTFNGIGAVPTSDPIVYGVLSRMGTELSTRVLADADVVVAVGNSFNAISTSRWTVKLPQKIIQIDLDPSILGRYYADRTVGILGDARSALNELHGMLAKPNSDAASAKARKDRLASLATVREAWRKKAVQENTAAAGQISPDTVVTAVRKVTPADAIAVFDAGNPGVWSYLWEIEKIDTYLKPVGYGNMGFAVPAAIATKVVRPETPVVVFVGDGSLGMTLGELETVAREKLPMCIVVMNDRGYGNIRQEQIVHFEGRTVGVDFTDADYAAVARAQGLEAVRVTTVADLTKAVENAFSSGRPWLVEALIDPDVNAWTYPLFRRYQAA